jgi:flagellar protein FlaG
MEVKPAAVQYVPKKMELPFDVSVKSPEQQEKPKNEVNEKITKEMLKDKVDGMNEFLVPTPTEIKFKLHEKLNVYYVLVEQNADAILKNSTCS